MNARKMYVEIYARANLKEWTTVLKQNRFHGNQIVNPKLL